MSQGGIESEVAAQLRFSHDARITKVEQIDLLCQALHCEDAATTTAHFVEGSRYWELNYCDQHAEDCCAAMEHQAYEREQQTLRSRDFRRRHLLDELAQL